MSGTMARIARKCKPSRSAAKPSGGGNGTRSHLEGGVLRRDANDRLRLVVTDGYKVARIRVEGDAHEGPVTREALKALDGTDEFLANERVRVETTRGLLEFERTQKGRFPDVESLFPDRPPTALRCCVNPRYLWDLAQALGADGATPNACLTLIFNEDGFGPNGYARAIYVEAANGDGILMPVKIL